MPWPLLKEEVWCYIDYLLFTPHIKGGFKADNQVLSWYGL